MYLGRFQLGDRLPLVVLTRDGSGQPELPDAAPGAALYPPGATAPAVSLELPPADPIGSPGLFLHALHLGRLFAAGEYRVRYSWTAGGLPRSATGSFTILPGGHPDGTVIAMYRFRRPHADFIIQQLDGGVRVKGRNPTV
jgi:hypothetical protein